MLDFQTIPEEDDLEILFEKFQTRLKSHATDGEMDNKEYRRIRKLILSNPQFKSSIPEFIKVCRNVDEF